MDGSRQLSTRVCTGAQWLLQALEEEGCEVMFGYPGGAVMPVYDALVDSSIRHILVRHEQGAALAADGSTSLCFCCLESVFIAMRIKSAAHYRAAMLAGLDVERAADLLRAVGHDAQAQPGAPLAFALLLSAASAAS